jgi:hypothetical protein
MYGCRCVCIVWMHGCVALRMDAERVHVSAAGEKEESNARCGSVTCPTPCTCMHAYIHRATTCMHACMHGGAVDFDPAAASRLSLSAAAQNFSCVFLTLLAFDPFLRRTMRNGKI